MASATTTTLIHKGRNINFVKQNLSAARVFDMIASVMDFLALCYHYIRDRKSAGRFPRILGNNEGEFRRHLAMLKQNYRPLSLDDLRRFSYGHPKTRTKPRARIGIFLSFDDGLSDHYLAARILAEHDIRGTFFIPTCILKDKQPANPQIIHYILAHRGIAAFLRAYEEALRREDLVGDRQYHILYRRGDDPWPVIARIKQIFKYGLSPVIARKILLDLYEELLHCDNPDILTEIHLDERQIKEMLAMGHSIGVHTHTHLSVAASKLGITDFEAEVVLPQKYLEQVFGVKVDALSYPFGEKQDCLDSETLVKNTSLYKFAFTVENVVNTRKTNPFELGRYMPHSKDSAASLRRILKNIENK